MLDLSEAAKPLRRTCFALTALLFLASQSVVAQDPDPTCNVTDTGTTTSEVFCDDEFTDPMFEGTNVCVFDTDMDRDMIQDTISAVYDQQRFNQFGSQRYVFAFKPNADGTPAMYELDIRVGYYTQVIGLGATPDDVVIVGAIRTQDGVPDDPEHPDNTLPGALNNFWRSTENISIQPRFGSICFPEETMDENQDYNGQNVWAVSQAAPLRRIHVQESMNDGVFAPGNLRLFDIGFSSGGYMCNSVVDGTVETGSQQQWFTCSSSFSEWEDPTKNINMVFVGLDNETTLDLSPTPRSDAWSDYPYTNAGSYTSSFRQKPYLVFDHCSKGFEVMVPTLKAPWEIDNSVEGIMQSWTEAQGVPLSDFFVANPEADCITDDIQTALDQGQNILFLPGRFHLTTALRVTYENTLLIGMGFATLVNDSQTQTLVIDDVDGVTLAGILFDAGPNGTPEGKSLLQVGKDHKTGVSHERNPTFLYDVFLRVGGLDPVGKADSGVTINSNDVSGDNFWIWRADHADINAPDSLIGWTVNTVDHGVIVNGDNVKLYGLAVEHFQKNQVLWNGNKGATYFYQSEIPYDVPDQASWMDGTRNGYASYKVNDHVREHQAFGLGIYSFFNNAPGFSSNHTFLDSAIQAPESAGISFTHMVTVWLAGFIDSGIHHIINDQGGEVNGNNTLTALAMFTN
eukprot:Clim_evm4s99 gene=Clim_evmTU4s99